MTDSIKRLRKKMKLPGSNPRAKAVSKKHIGRPFGSPVSQKQLNALRSTGAQPGEVLNPYGKVGAYCKGNMKTDVTGFDRESGIRRKRAQLVQKKAVALEMHELQQLARENATAAMQTLIEISNNKRAPESSRIAASAVILDRGYGKSSQTSITASVTDGKASKITADQLDERIGQALKRVEAITKRTPKAAPGKDRPADLRKYN